MNGPTLGHASDLHLPFEPRLSFHEHFSKRQLSVWSWRRRHALHRPDILDALASDLKSQGVEHLLITGDIANFSLPGEFEHAARWLEALGLGERISLVPGNHDALVPVDDAIGIGLWKRWSRRDGHWPFVHRIGGISVIGLNSGLPTAPLLAQGRLGDEQLARLETVLAAEAGQVRIVMLHHPPTDAAVNWRKSLVDRRALRRILRSAGAELVLHGHARDARLDSLAGPGAPIPCVCVPSSSAVPSAFDQGARWHRMRLCGPAHDLRMEIEVRRWSNEAAAFVTGGTYALCLPRPVAAAEAKMAAPPVNRHGPAMAS